MRTRLYKVCQPVHLKVTRVTHVAKVKARTVGTGNEVDRGLDREITDDREILM
jgi:hypothetical protein